jgi:hypothetical protein
VRLGRVWPTTVLHHRRAHHGDAALFFDVSNLEPLAKSCHDALTARSRKSNDGKQIQGGSNLYDPPLLRTGAACRAREVGSGQGGRVSKKGVWGGG